MIRLSKPQDGLSIAKLHSEYINKGFLTSLGLEFLEILYRSIATSKNAFCLVYEHEGRIVGFVSASTDIRKFYKEFIGRNFFVSIFALLPRLVNIRNVRKVLETLTYPSKGDTIGLPEAEILSIVVEKKHQGGGISEALFNEMKNEFRKRNIRKFRVVVGANLIRARKFYEKTGGKLKGEVYVHEGEKSYVYEWEI